MTVSRFNSHHSKAGLRYLRAIPPTRSCTELAVQRPHHPRVLAKKPVRLFGRTRRSIAARDITAMYWHIGMRAPKTGKTHTRRFYTSLHGEVDRSVCHGANCGKCYLANLRTI